MDLGSGGRSPDRTPHPAVLQAAGRHLKELDRAAPGLVEMLYLTGSVALGDYRHGVSDVDFLAVTSRPPDCSELASLAGIQEAMRVAPGGSSVAYYDGVYLDRPSLGSMPDEEQPVPHVVGGEFRADHPCGELNPVLWWTLVRCGVTVRGPAATGLGLRPDPARLRRYNLDNLRTYWQPLAGQIRTAVAERAPGAPARAEGVAWAALGAPRLHYTLATRRVTSKSAAAAYVAETFPAWADLAARARSWRAGEDLPFRSDDALAAADLVDAVAEDAWWRFGRA